MNRHCVAILVLTTLLIPSTWVVASAQDQTVPSWFNIAVPEVPPAPKKHAKPTGRTHERTHVRQKPAPSKAKAAAPTSAKTVSENTPPPPPKTHRVVIQVTQNDPALMKTALNNAENLSSFYREKSENVQIEFVAYGPGLHMLRSDTSPVMDRIRSIAEKNKQIIFSGCGNTLQAQSKQENKDLTLVPEARIVPAGIARITELQEQGWTYVRP